MRTRFPPPPDRQQYNERVWALVRKVPAGKVTTYGRIAELVGPPDDVDVLAYRAHGARWVGRAMADCPEDIPWQRVINAQGKISMRSGSGPRRQRALLEAEGIEFSAADRINLKKYEWKAR